MSPTTVTTPSSCDRSIERELATTAQPSLRYACTSAAPIPCDAPVMTATFWLGIVMMLAPEVSIGGRWTHAPERCSAHHHHAPTPRARPANTRAGTGSSSLRYWSRRRHIAPGTD